MVVTRRNKINIPLALANENKWTELIRFPTGRNKENIIIDRQAAVLGSIIALLFFIVIRHNTIIVLKNKVHRKFYSSNFLNRTWTSIPARLVETTIGVGKPYRRHWNTSFKCFINYFSLAAHRPGMPNHSFRLCSFSEHYMFRILRPVRPLGIPSGRRLVLSTR